MARIVLVDDDLDILAILRLAFEAAGHEAMLCPDPLRLPDLLVGEPIDAVVLDVMMPQRSGWDVLSELRRDPRTATLPVIMLSALGEPENRVRGLRLGADDFVAKPYHAEEVVVRVEGLISRRDLGPAGLRGDISVFPVSDAFQAIEQRRLSGWLEVTGPIGAVGPARLGFLRGRCVAAALGRLDPLDVAFELLELRSGRFHFEAVAPDGLQGSPCLPAMPELLLRAAWIEDELERRRAVLPRLDRALTVSGDPPAGLASDNLPAVPLQRVLEYLLAHPGATTADLLAAGIASQLRLLLAVARLAELGVFGPVPAAAVAAVAAPVVEVLEAVDGGQELDEWLDELAREAQLRGLPTDTFRLLVLAPPAELARWRRLLQLRQGRLITHGTLARAGEELRIVSGGRGLALQAWPVARNLPDPPSAQLGTAAAVVLLRPGQAGEELIARLDGRIDPAAFRLRLEGPAVQAAIHPGWRLSRRTPECLEDLLEQLLSPLLLDEPAALA